LQSIRGGSGYSKHSQPTRVPQCCITLLPVAAADGIDDQINTATVSELLQDRQPILVAIVDSVIQSAFAQELMLSWTRRSVSCRADLPGDVDGCQADTATGIVNKNGVAGVQRTHHVKQRVSGQVINGNGRRQFEAERLRFGEKLICGDRNF